MSMEHWRLGQLAKGNSAAAKIAEGLVEQFGDVPFPSAETRSLQVPGTQVETGKPLDLNAEWQRQTQGFIELGFHTELGLSEEKYLESLPRFEPQPEQFKGRFDIPVIVETRIPVKRQSELTRLPYFLEGLEVVDWLGDPKGYKTPKIPYFTWLQDGAKNINRSVRDVRATFAEDERGATEFDGISLYIAHPEILKDHFIDLPGTTVGSHDAPFLFLWLDRPGLYCLDVGFPGSEFSSASCGRI